MGINFSDFAITSSKMCDEFNISRYNFLVKMGQLANFAKLSIRKQ